MDCGEEGKIGLPLISLQDSVDLVSGELALKLLTLEHLLSQSFHGLFSPTLREGRCHPPVSPAIAAGHEVSDPTGLQEGLLSATGKHKPKNGTMVVRSKREEEVREG